MAKCKALTGSVVKRLTKFTTLVYFGTWMDRLDFEVKCQRSRTWWDQIWSKLYFWGHFVIIEHCQSHSEFTSKWHYLHTKLDTLFYHHTYRTFSWTIIQLSNWGHYLPTYFQNQLLLSCLHNEPYLHLSQPYGTHSHMTCILLTLLAHLNLSERAHCFLQLMAASRSMVHSHSVLLIRSLFTTWALYKSDIVSYCIVNGDSLNWIGCVVSDSAIFGKTMLKDQMSRGRPDQI